MAEKDIRWEEIKVLYAYKYERGGGYELRVGRWLVDGRGGEPILEKREWWENNEGKKMAGKPKGFSKGDLYRVFEMAGELSQLLGFPLPKEFGAAAQSEISSQPKNDAKTAPVSAPSSRF